MNKTKSGFTIVELLIVIVVIGILAAITITAYNGMQARARDNIRYSDAKTIMKALELFKADNGSYPNPTSGTHSGTGSQNGCTGGSYSYSWASDGTWMKALVDGGYLQKVPVPPDSDCTHYYRYLHPSATSYTCSRTSGYYVLEIVGTDRTMAPSDASSTPEGNWKPCVGATAAWGSGKNNWAFAKDDI